MRFFSFAYRAVSNFALLAIGYFSLNYIDQYQNRAILAMMFLLYAGMRAVTVLRSFQFFGRIERLEVEMRRLLGAVAEATGMAPSRKVVTDVAVLRSDSEKKAYIDLFFLAAIVIVCASKIVTN
jgi:hypothetical protein